MGSPSTHPRAPGEGEATGDLDAPAPAPLRASPARGRRLAPHLWVAGGAAAATVLVALRSPYQPGSYGYCPILAVTGLYCPGCGALRAVHDMAGGDLAGAWAMNPLLVLAVPVVVGLWVWSALRAWRGRPVRVVPTTAVLGLAVVLVGFMVARNLPALEPWLAPR